MPDVDEEPTLDQRLLDVQKLLNAPKNRKNTFGNYSYRSAEDILEAVKPLLHDYGLMLVLTDNIVEVGGRVYVKATACISRGTNAYTVHAFAREEETKKGMDAAQITGSASSYARKYALNGLFLIDDDKDADTDEYHKQTRDAPQNRQNGRARTQDDQGIIVDPDNGEHHVNPLAWGKTTTPHAEQPITDQQKRQIFALSGEIAEAKGWAKTWVKDDLYAFFQVGSTTNLTTAQAAKAIAALYQVKDKNAVFADALQAMKG